jgi:hypothetical protein
LQQWSRRWLLGACDGAEPKAQATAAPESVAATSQRSAVVAAAPESGYRWHTAQPGESVQYGVPETDDRLLRIDCDEGGRIKIGGPAGVDGPEGAQVSATFGEGAAARTLPALLAEAGDGTNFYAEVGPDDPALQTLLTGRSLKVAQGAYSWEVPGEGAAAELRPFMQLCRTSTRSQMSTIGEGPP